MRSRLRPSARRPHVVRWLLLPALLLAPGPASPQWSDRQGTFQGYWTLSGTVHVLEYKDGARVAAGRLQGTVVIQSSSGPIPAFETDCVQFAEENATGIGRCVWTGTNGGLVYVELKASGPAGFGAVQGRFAGGTGDYEGIEGSFAFEWNYSVSGSEEARLDGQTLQMSGRYQLP